MKKILLLLIFTSFITCSPERLTNVDSCSSCETSDMGIDTTARYYPPTLEPMFQEHPTEWQWFEKRDSLIIYGSYSGGGEGSNFDYLFFKKENHCIKFVKYI